MHNIHCGGPAPEVVPPAPVAVVVPPQTPTPAETPKPEVKQ